MSAFTSSTFTGYTANLHQRSPQAALNFHENSRKKKGVFPYETEEEARRSRDESRVHRGN